VKTLIAILNDPSNPRFIFLTWEAVTLWLYVSLTCLTAGFMSIGLDRVGLTGIRAWGDPFLLIGFFVLGFWLFGCGIALISILNLWVVGRVQRNNG